MVMLLTLTPPELELDEELEEEELLEEELLEEELLDELEVELVELLDEELLLDEDELAPPSVDSPPHALSKVASTATQRLCL